MKYQQNKSKKEITGRFQKVTLPAQLRINAVWMARWTAGKRARIRARHEPQIQDQTQTGSRTVKPQTVVHSERERYITHIMDSCDHYRGTKVRQTRVCVWQCFSPVAIRIPVPGGWRPPPTYPRLPGRIVDASSNSVTDFAVWTLGWSAAYPNTQEEESIEQIVELRSRKVEQARIRARIRHSTQPVPCCRCRCRC